MMRFPGFTVATCESVMIFSLVFVTLSTVSSLERDFPQDSRTRQLIAADFLYPRNYYQLYHDMEPWKRAPSAGWFGMRGKKVPSSNFFGMRGKKGPSGFLGMRGKKQDPYTPLDNSNEQFSPTDSFEDVWTPSKPGYEPEDFQATRHSDPREDKLLTVKTNLGKINI